MLYLSPKVHLIDTSNGHKKGNITEQYPQGEMDKTANYHCPREKNKHDFIQYKM